MTAARRAGPAGIAPPAPDAGCSGVSLGAAASARILARERCGSTVNQMHGAAPKFTLAYHKRLEARLGVGPPLTGRIPRG